MFTHLLNDTGDLQVFSIIGLVFFLIFFIGILIWVWRMGKPFVTYMSNLPFNDNIDNKINDGGING